MTPEETVLLLQALGFKSSFQIYIAAGETFGGGRRMANLITAFPNTVRHAVRPSCSEGLRLLLSASLPTACMLHLPTAFTDCFVPISVSDCGERVTIGR